jgi:hypothetical protein
VVGQPIILGETLDMNKIIVYVLRAACTVSGAALTVYLWAFWLYRFFPSVHEFPFISLLLGVLKLIIGIWLVGRFGGPRSRVAVDLQSEVRLERHIYWKSVIQGLGLGVLLWGVGDLQLSIFFIMQNRN